MVDRSIARLLRYPLMPRLRLGATAVACIVGFWTTGCAGKKQVPLPSAPTAAVPVVAAPAPATAVRPLQLATVASAPRPAAPDVARQPLSARAGDRPAASQAEGQNPAQPQTHQPVIQTPTTDFPEPKPEPAPIDDLLTIPPAETPEPTPATTRTVAEDLSAHPREIEIPQNERVLSYVELFSGRLQGYLEDGLNRGSQYLPMIQEVFRSEGVPLDLAYVPLVESAFKPNAVSRAKAKGIWQFMRGTALENGLKHDWYLDERADPEKATRAAARYLKTLYGMFGDWNLALASYNGGPGRVQKAIRRSGKRDFWAISKSRKYLPRETREYVPLILAAVTVARNPTQYGMSLTPVADPGVDRVMLPAAVDLRRIAEWTGAPLATIQALNPELRRWTTPVRATEYELKVPAGQADAVRARLAESDGADLSPHTRYVVRKNETMASVARKLGVTRADLAEANYLAVSTKISQGQSLIVPKAPTLAIATNAAKPPSPDASEGDVEGAVNTVAVASVAVDAVEPAADRASAAGAAVKAAAVVPARATSGTSSASRAGSARIVHRVKAGETLTSIAKTYGTTVVAVKASNHLHSSTIHAGQRLSIPVKRATATN